MKLIINNLGFVKKSEIDLDKDLILLCGTNNTGKTYVAYTIYGLMKSKSIGLPSIPSLINQITSLRQEKAIEINLAEFLDIHQNHILNYIASEYQKQLSSIFSADITLFEQTRLSLELNTSEFLKNKLLTKTIKQKVIIQNKLHFLIEKPANSFICSFILVEIEDNGNKKTSISPVLLENILFEQISELFLNWLFPECYIAPTERIAINLFSKELALRRNLLVDELSNITVTKEQDNQPLDLIKQRTSRYSLPIRDSLKIAEDLVNIKKNNTQFTYLAEEIEKSILHGNISVSQEGEMQFQPQ